VGVPCTAQQQANAIKAAKGGFPDWKLADPNQKNTLIQQLGGLYKDSAAGLSDGSITAVLNGNKIILVPTAWLVSPQAPQPPINPGIPADQIPSSPPRQDCRFCENGNQKSEQVIKGFCYPSDMRCEDYKLPVSSPINTYRFPICQSYANGTKNKLATRANPISSHHQFTLKGEAGTTTCRIKFVESDGTENLNSTVPSALQVVDCPITIATTSSGQDLVIESTTLPAEGYGQPVWGERNASDPNTCDIVLPGSSSYRALPFDPYPIQVIALPFTSSWIKVADGAYTRSGNGSTPLVNYLPGFVEPFNSSDKDTSSSLPHFLTAAGAGISLGTVQVGSVATISAPNWKADPYINTPSNTPTSLFKEIIQKQTYQEYTQTSSAPNTLTLSDAITVIDTPTTYTLASLAFAGDKPSYTLIIKNGSNLGNLTIDTASLNPSGSPALLIIADTITLTPSVSTLGAVIIARTMNAGSGSELFIKGNLSLTTPLTHTRVRADQDDRKPTIFIEFSPDTYLSLLPLLGSSSREWSQIE
jgi:hypothetical protein